MFTNLINSKIGRTQQCLPKIVVSCNYNYFPMQSEAQIPCLKIPKNFYNTHLSPNGP